MPVGMNSSASAHHIVPVLVVVPDFAPSSETSDFASSSRLREATSGRLSSKW
jgi:hypothetical protein